MSRMQITLVVLLALGWVGGVHAQKVVHGKIKSIDAEKKELVVTNEKDSKDMTFVVDGSTGKYTIQVDGKNAKLEDLKADDPVRVGYDTNKDKPEVLVAEKVQVKHVKPK